MNIKNLNLFIVFVLLLITQTTNAQMGIGTTTPNANAALELFSTTQGMLFPRMTSAQRDDITSPAKGLTIFNTTLDCIQTNIGTSAAANWKCLGISPTSNGTAIVSAYTCSTASAGSMVAGIEISSGIVKQTITATVTIVGTYSISTTANGVTFAGSGTFAGTGAQLIELTATGTPTAATASPYSYTLNTTPNCSFSRTTIDPLPPNITLSAIGSYFVTSVYDQDYLPYTAPTGAASLATAQAANGTNETTTLNIQGILRTTGVTLKIPYTVQPGYSVNLQIFTQTINVPASYTQDGIARDVTFSYGIQNSLAGSSTITATLKAVGDTLKAKKLDIQTGIGNDNLGWLMAQFTYATNNSGGTANFQFRNIAAIPDRKIDDAAHVMFYMPVLGADGKTWLNNNLGANYANTTKVAFNPAAQASSSTDANAYGSLFQWGRGADGHEFRTSGNTAGPIATPWTSTNFITNSTSPNDWRTPQDVNIWQGVSGSNNPCPIGYRLPTETEMTNQKSTWASSNSAGAFGSPIKLTVAGRRNAGDGSLSDVNTVGVYWISTVSSASSRSFGFNSTLAEMYNDFRVFGFAVRCIANDNPSNGTAIVSAYDCSTASAGTMTAGTAVSGVTQTITATVTTVGTYNISSTTANGVTFAKTGTFTGTGNQQIELIATGTPTYGTTDAFTLNTTPNCSFNRTATGNASTNGTAIVSAYTCSTASAGSMVAGIAISSGVVTQTITATVTTAGTYSMSSTANGVTFAGSGTFAGTGAQNIVLTATGAPTAAGTHTFTLNTTPNCNFSRYASVTGCYAKITATTYKDFLCHNLGADTSLNPHVPVVGLQGAYIQWGRRGPNTTGNSRVDWKTAANTANFGAAPTSGNANAAAISGWSTTAAANNAWLTTAGAKTADDPCPVGYRVPTSTEWTGVNSNNTASRTGTSSNSTTNYGSALHYGPNASTKLLTLAAAGFRFSTTGTLNGRGSNGYYWSSAEDGTNAFSLDFNFSLVVPANSNNRTIGFSLRCIAE